jgi:hypothetical protein
MVKIKFYNRRHVMLALSLRLWRFASIPLEVRVE